MPCIVEDEFWPPNTTLQIFFMDSGQELNDRVLNYAKEWTQCSSISFEQTHFIEHSDIRIMFTQRETSCYLGKECLHIPKNLPTMYIARNTMISESDFKRSILCMFGIALGLCFEHLRDDIPLNMDKASDFIFKNFGLSRLESSKLTTPIKDFRCKSKIDPDSIMNIFKFPNECFDLECSIQNIKQLPCELSDFDKMIFRDFYRLQ
jgi:hypothetical protein